VAHLRSVLDHIRRTRPSWVLAYLVYNGFDIPTIATAVKPQTGNPSELGWDVRRWAMGFDVGRCWESDVESGKLVVDEMVQRAKRRGEVGIAR
jgi:hypothetical protein